VKIYREPENESMLLDDEQVKEYNNLVKKLSLTNEIKDTTPSVYIPLNDAMTKLLKALCPAEVSIEDYKKSTIPVEVLKVVDYAKQNKMFDGFLVWYADKQPDPMLIGWNYESEDARINKYSWRKDFSIIARWGDCALEMDELLKKGFESLKISLIDSAKEVLAVSETILKDPDSYVRKHLKSTLQFPRLEINGTSSLGELPF